MSLQVWLPLNGNLNNQGLSDVTITNNGATIDNNGKIGKCYSFSNNWMIAPIINLDTTNGLSLACWVYPIATASGNTHLVTFASRAGWVYNPFGLLLKSGTSSVITTASDGTNTIKYSCQSSDLPLNTWTHICSTYFNKKLTVYLNGIQHMTYNITFDISLSGINSLNIGGCKNGDETLANCKLNDVRFYDHCLSPKEVKEISKGLCLHYPLNNGGFGNENLVKNTNVDSTSYFGLAEAAGGSTKEIVYDNGIPCVNVTRNSTEHSGWHYIWHNSVDLDKIKTDTNYTVSLDVKASVSGTMSLVGLLNGNATNYMNNSTTSVKNQYIANTWSHLVFNMKTISSFSDISVGSQVVYFQSNALLGTGVSFMVKNFKLEEGLKPTSWIPNGADALYSAIGLNSTTVADCSGFNNNGTRSGTLTYSADSPRYSGSYRIDSTSTKIKAGALNTTGFANSYTFSWWEKNSGTGNMPWGFSDGNRLNLFHSVKLCWNTGDSENNPFKDSSGAIIPNSRLCDNVWHHCVVTGDGTTTKLYIDGVYAGSATTYKPLTGTQIYLSGWDSGTNYTFSGSCLSDFRIYATALSAEDILELYNSPINIDNKGNLYAYEFIEEDKNNFSKQGIAKNSEFIDLDTAGDSYINASISSTVDYANIFIEK